jgi:hypothetical protein
MIKWYDIYDGLGRLFNTVKARNSADALKRSNRQAYLIGIKGRRSNPPYAYAELTPSNGIHPY